MIDLTVSRRYAKALLMLGQEDGKYKEYGEELSGFAQLLEREPELKDALLNPIHGLEERKQLLFRVAELINLSPLVSNFLKLLFDKHRLAALNGIAQVYQQFVDDIENVKRAHVKAAVAMDEAMQERLRQGLEKMTKSKVVMDFEEDPAIIGGIVARVGDLVLDGSVRTQLSSLRESLIKGEVL
ncbi:MAG: F0F1 ATP synthase subunit delta [Deltaproteobacteria bacterium]|nr:F0F1 ATP synthase subunit delta [Deltaproteobacteria bacterium]